MNMSNWEKRLQLLYDRRAKGLLAGPPISLDQQRRALSRIADGTENAAISRDLNLAHGKSIRAMRSSAKASNFEITYLSSLAIPRPKGEVTYPIRDVERLETLSAKERQQIEAQLRRYHILARTRAEAESRYATGRTLRTAPLVHKRELPEGTPAERRFDPPPAAKKGGKDGSKGGGAQFHRQRGAPPAVPMPRLPIRKKK